MYQHRLSIGVAIHTDRVRDRDECAARYSMQISRSGQDRLEDPGIASCVVPLSAVSVDCGVW